MTPKVHNPQPSFVAALLPARSASCDELAAQVWILPGRWFVVAHSIADCIIREIFSSPHQNSPERPWLAAIDAIQDGASRAAARKALSRKTSPLDDVALRLLDKLDGFDGYVGLRDQAFGQLFSASGVVAMCLIRAERAGIQQIGERLTKTLGALVAHQRRTVKFADGNALDELAYSEREHGVPHSAAQLFEQAADAYLALKRPEDAFRTLSNAAQLWQQPCKPDKALSAVERALLIPVPNDKRVIAAMTKGYVLDGLDRVEAVDAWLDAAKLHTMPPSIAFCMAHSCGALIKHGQNNFADVGAIIARGQPMTNGQRAGVIGAAGQSAGERGTGLLAQAVLVICETPDAWIPSTVSFWSWLLNRVGLDTSAALELCGLGYILTASQPDSPDFRSLMASVEVAFEAIARARKIHVDQLREMAVPPSHPGAVGEHIELVKRTLRSLVPVEERIFDRSQPRPSKSPAVRAPPASAPEPPRVSTAGPSRTSRFHPPWTTGHYVTYFLDRSDGSWVAIALHVVELRDAWLIVANTKQPELELEIFFQFVPSVETGDGMRFKPLDAKVKRGTPADTQGTSQLAMIALVQNLLYTADNAAFATPEAQIVTGLPCDVHEIEAVDIPSIAYTARHELCARIPITGLARTTIPDRAFSLVVGSFGLDNAQVRKADFDDHVNLSHAKRAEHDGFALTYPATWFLREAPVTGLDAPVNNVRYFMARDGGNGHAIRCGVTVFSGSIAEMDRIERDMLARWSARHASQGGAFIPDARFPVPGGTAYTHAFEHPHLDGVAVTAAYRDRSHTRFATVVAVCNTLKENPRRDEIMRACRAPLADIVASFELRDDVKPADRALN